jgi:hypothetical protein
MLRAALAVTIAATLAVAPAAHAQWRTEPVPSEETVGLLDLAFDSRGNGLLSWEGFHQRGTERFTALDTRAPAGTWERARDLSGVGWGGAQIHLYAKTRALLVTRRRPDRLVYATGRSDGTFDTPHTLAREVVGHVSAANASGEAIVVYENGPRDRTRLVERRPGGGFGSPIAPAGLGAAAINDAGDRMIAWWGPDGVYARVRRAGHDWGRAVRAVRAQHAPNAQVRAVITPGGRFVIAWYSADVREAEPILLAAGVAIRDGSSWSSFRLERASLPEQAFDTDTPAIPVIDSAKRTYVAWTGANAGAPAVKLAQVTASGPRGEVLLSGSIPGAAVDDAAAGPNQALAVSWSAVGTTYASLRRGGGVFAAPERLVPAGVTGFGDSRVAFQPLSGEAVVAWSYGTAGGTGAIQASVSPPG